MHDLALLLFQSQLRPSEEAALEMLNCAKVRYQQGVHHQKDTRNWYVASNESRNRHVVTGDVNAEGLNCTCKGNNRCKTNLCPHKLCVLISESSSDQHFLRLLENYKKVPRQDLQKSLRNLVKENKGGLVGSPSKKLGTKHEQPSPSPKPNKPKAKKRFKCLNPNCDQNKKSLDGAYGSCPYCGTKRVYCECGEEIGQTYRFCPKCTLKVNHHLHNERPSNSSLQEPQNPNLDAYMNYSKTVLIAACRDAGLAVSGNKHALALKLVEKGVQAASLAQNSPSGSSGSVVITPRTPARVQPQRSAPAAVSTPVTPTITPGEGLRNRPIEAFLTFRRAKGKSPMCRKPNCKKKFHQKGQIFIKVRYLHRKRVYSPIPSNRHREIEVDDVRVFCIRCRPRVNVRLESSEFSKAPRSVKEQAQKIYDNLQQ